MFREHSELFKWMFDIVWKPSWTYQQYSNDDVHWSSLNIPVSWEGRYWQTESKPQYPIPCCCPLCLSSGNPRAAAGRRLVLTPFPVSLLTCQSLGGTRRAARACAGAAAAAAAAEGAAWPGWPPGGTSDSRERRIPEGNTSRVNRNKSMQWPWSFPKILNTE